MYIRAGDPHMAVELPAGFEINFVAEIARRARSAGDQRGMTATVERIFRAFAPKEIPAERNVGRRGGPNRYGRIDVDQVGQGDEARRGEISIARIESVEGAERAALRVAVAAGDIGLEAETRGQGRPGEGVAGIRRGHPGEDVAIAEAAGLQHQFTIVVPRRRSAPQSRADRVPELVRGADVEAGILAVEPEIIEI